MDIKWNRIRIQDGVVEVEAIIMKKMINNKNPNAKNVTIYIMYHNYNKIYACNVYL